MQTWRYSNVATIVPNTLKPMFISAHSSLVVTRRFARIVRSRRSSFRGVTTVHDHPERGLSFMSLSQLLKYATHGLTVLTSTVWSPCTECTECTQLGSTTEGTTTLRHTGHITTHYTKSFTTLKAYRNLYRGHT
jgi:hypothetical protein